MAIRQLRIEKKLITGKQPRWKIFLDNEEVNHGNYSDTRKASRKLTATDNEGNAYGIFIISDHDTLRQFYRESMKVDVLLSPLSWTMTASDFLNALLKRIEIINSAFNELQPTTGEEVATAQITVQDDVDPEDDNDDEYSELS